MYGKIEGKLIQSMLHVPEAIAFNVGNALGNSALGIPLSLGFTGLTYLMAKKKVQININAEDLKKKLNIKDGYSPIKGVDYFDGKTPVKGVDYFDGEVPDTTEVALEASKMAQIELKSKIPTISQIVSELPSFGAEVRDSLELLQGEDRLDKSAIRGLDDYDEISKLARQPKKEIKKYYNSTTPGLQNPVDYIQFNASLS